MSLNPADPKPLYQQLAGMIRTQIEQGELAPGDRIPTEGDLAERHGTSRNTIRLALNLLRSEGLLISQQGKGTFVREAPAMRYHAMLSGSRQKRLEAHGRRDTFSQQVEAQGKVPLQVSSVEVIPADLEVAAHLGQEVGRPTGVRRRVMYADGIPIQLGDSYYPLSIVDGSKIMRPEDVVEGTDQVLEDLGHTPTRYEDEITWRMPTADEAIKLHIPPGTPIGRLLRTTFDQHGDPVEVYILILPSDRHVLLYEVSAV